ncbi:Enhancer of polycomb-like protein 1 [Marasmius sp. AFHP31]|nr:Enhancer of polycomb-like protein 1 [Marasmius sp. AFHP31]
MTCQSFHSPDPCSGQPHAESLNIQGIDSSRCEDKSYSQSRLSFYSNRQPSTRPSHLYHSPPLTTSAPQISNLGLDASSQPLRGSDVLASTIRIRGQTTPTSALFRNDHTWSVGAYRSQIFWDKALDTLLDNPSEIETTVFDDVEAEAMGWECGVSVRFRDLLGRLKVIKGNIDTDPVVVDEDEEKNRLLQSVAGVDQEDANVGASSPPRLPTNHSRPHSFIDEHHLQAVLSAAALQHNNSALSLKEEKKKEDSAAFIPIPDSTGLVDDHEKLYPPNRYRDPVGYVQSTSTVEDLTDASLAGGFIYLMDERDAEWLTKNNEEARGEGTSAQGAVSGSRPSSRGTKSKGKEPDSPQPVAITEDQFELVMGLFEKVTHEKTEFLHHSLETGMDFPPFADYQDTFSSSLSSSMFASHKTPSWLPSSADLLQMAKMIYPYWKERRLERSGHSIIPTLNFDESDTLNESFVCFRRRDVKAARKTRAAQVSSSDKLYRLQIELAQALQLADLVLQREQLKHECTAESRHVWEQRQQFIELRLKNPMLFEKGDEELLIDKERPTKKESTRVKIPAKADASHGANRPQFIPPRERSENCRATIESHLQRVKEVDQHWEDVVDTGYVAPPASYASRLFKYVTPPSTPRALSPEPGQENDGQRPRRAVRLRYGRGGRRFVDRRPQSDTYTLATGRKRPLDREEDELAEERDRRLRERWRFDSDDNPPYGPKGSDEQDRVLVDEFYPKHLQYTLDLTRDVDYGYMLNDPTIIRYTPDGKATPYLPFRPSLPSAFPFQPSTRPPVPVSQSPEKSAVLASSSRPGVFIPVSPAVAAQVTPGRRPVPSGTEAVAQQAAAIRVAAAPAPPLQREGVAATSTSPPQPPQSSQPVAHNVARGAINIPYVVKTDTTATSSISPTKESSNEQAKAQGQSVPQVNGANHSQALVNGHTSSSPSSTTAFHTAATTPTGEFKLKLPPVRQTTKPPSTTSTSRTSLPIKRPPSAMSGNAKMN